jgi:hypothetical protein
MKKVVIITHIDFWRHSSGCGARLLALVKFLSSYNAVTVFFGGMAIPSDEESVRELGFPVTLIYLDGNERLTRKGYFDRVKERLARHQFDLCIIEYIELSFLLDILPKGMPVILDTHDLQSDRNSSFQSYNLPPPGLLGETTWFTREEEMQIFGRYDRVVLIHQTDHDNVSASIGAHKTLLAPHPPEIVWREPRKKVKNIGFVASAYAPNVHGICDFIRNIWPSLEKEGVILNIFGRVGNQLEEAVQITDRIKIHGFIKDADAIYSDIDIAINPVRFGAGLKIKNMEALGNGIPLVTTSHGACGIEGGVGRCFRVADDPAKFGETLQMLIHNFDERKRLSDAAIAYISDNFSPERCFSDLLDYIHRA